MVDPGTLTQGGRLNYFRSVLTPLVEAAANRAALATITQTVGRGTFETLVRDELKIIRAEISRDVSDKRSDNDLRDQAAERVMARRVGESRERYMAAKNASAEARAALDQVRADAQRLSLGPIELPRQDAMAPSDRLILTELTALNRQMAVQAAERRLARITDPSVLLARLQAAEQAGDRATALAADELLQERLAAPRSDTLEAIAEHRTLRQKYDAHVDTRISEPERALLGEMEAAYAPVAAEVTSVLRLQVAINSVQQVSVVDEPVPAPAPV